MKMKKKNNKKAGIIFVFAASLLTACAAYSPTSPSGEEKTGVEKRTADWDTLASRAAEVPNRYYRLACLLVLPNESLEQMEETAWNRIYELAEAADTYYKENFKSTRLVTKGGRLFNQAAGVYVNTAYLQDEGMLSTENNETMSYEILLLYPRDVQSFPNLLCNEDGDTLTVFVSVKGPKGDGYYIGGAHSRGGVLTEDEYDKLLKPYKQRHGKLVRLSPQDEEYRLIMDCVKAADSNPQESYAVRRIKKDDKYASVIFSPATDTAEVKQYILEKKDSVYTILETEAEKIPRQVVEINRKYPDFNLELLDFATVYDYRNSLMRDFSEVISKILKEKLTDNIADISYLAGAGDYAYAAGNNIHLLFINNGGDEWEAESFSSAAQAEERMQELSKMAPLFIILDEEEGQ